MAKALIQVGRMQMAAISCKLCNKIYDNPQILNCLHSFCASCLQLQISQGNYNENKLLCPLCKECTYIEDGVENLPHNTVLSRFIFQAQHEELLLVCDRVISENTHELEKKRSQSEEGEEDSQCFEIPVKHQSGNDLDQSKCADNQLDKETSKTEQAVEGSYSSQIKHQSGNDLDQSKCADNQFKRESLQSEQGEEGIQNTESKDRSVYDLDKLKSAINQSENNMDQSKSVENQSGVTSGSNSCQEQGSNSNLFLEDSLEIHVSDKRGNTSEVFSRNELSLESLIENTERDVLRNQERKDLLEAIKLRESAKNLVTNLQENALGVVYALDSINLFYQEGRGNREDIKKAIKEKSRHLQRMIKCQERKLLSSVEDINIENNMKREMTNSKDQLQSVLRGSLNATEFLNLLIEFGNVTDFITFQDIINARASHLSNPNIQLKRHKFTFTPPLKDSNNFVEEAFGQLKEESSLQNIELNTNQIKHCEDTATPTSGHDDTNFPVPMSDQLQAKLSDETYGYSDYGLQYITVDKGPVSEDDDNSIKSYSEKSSDTLSEHTKTRCRRRMSFNDISSRAQNIASKKLQTRRTSVPANNSGIASNISQKRLYALSLLMRSKSQEEGTPSQLETNANIAQLEWIRENIRKKTLSRQSSQLETT